MRTLILTALMITPAFAVAAPRPVEVLKVKILANIDRCTKHAGINALDCKHSPDAVLKTIAIALDQCDNQSFFGPNCGGEWTTTLKRGDVKYKFLLLIGHYYKAPGFEYQVSLRIFQNGLSLDNAASNDFYMKDANFPYSSNVVGARTAHIGYSGDETVMFTPEFAIGDGVKLDL